MASPAKIVEVLPDTLPEDFGAWDNEESASTQPIHLVRPGHYLEKDSFRAETAGSKPARKKPLILAGASVVLLVVFAAIAIPVWSHRTASPPKPVSVAVPVVNVIQPEPKDVTLGAPLSTAAVPAPPQQHQAAVKLQHSPAVTSASDEENTNISQAHAQMMNEQLNAPKQIHIAAAPTPQAPPPPADIAAGDMDGPRNDSAIVRIFSDVTQPRVQAAPPSFMAVSSGVAFGLLLEKRLPVYPPTAKSAGIHGTVVLAATITKAGTVANLRAVSGPAILRESAVNAVRSWRYRPYMVNSQPTEIETTIDVAFSLDK